MAYIRKRGKTWYYTIDLGRKPNGERDQVTKGGHKTKKEAEAAASRALTEREDGTYVRPTKASFDEFCEKWMEIYEASGVKNGSIRTRKTRMNKLKKYFGALKLSGITRSMYQDMLLALRNEENLANETIISTHATGKLIFRSAVELGLIKIDPTQYAKVPRVRKTVEDIESGKHIPKYLEKEELSKFLETAKEHETDFDYAFFMMLAYTGLRIGELLVLRWSDVDMDNMMINITKTYDNESNNTRAYKLAPPKTEAGERIIDFDEVVKKVLEEQAAKLKPYKMRFRKTYYDKDYIFPNINKYPGYPNTQKHYEKRMEGLLKLAGLPDHYTPHSLRHTHTTLLAEAGATLAEIMERLGHKDDKTTRLVYLHVTKEMKRGTSKKFSDLMSKVVKM